MIKGSSIIAREKQLHQASTNVLAESQCTSID